MNTTAVTTARFETPYLHEGHKFLVKEIEKRHNKVVVILDITQVQGSLNRISILISIYEIDK